MNRFLLHKIKCFSKLEATLSTHTEDLQIPTTILTQMGITNVLPKLGRGETLPYGAGTPNGYSKRPKQKKGVDKG